jgi:F-type H+-transporting ATPase subunit a|tara:strand:+ start:275 stop:1204 length:930 start_codon:yes stop_codon:yes gene_type:complete
MLVSPNGHGSSGVMDQVGDNIIHHVSNSDIHHPIFHLPHLFNIDMSVTKHVLMLWIVAFSVGLFVIIPVQKYIQQQKLIPKGLMSFLEIVVSFVRDSIVKPNVGPKWVNNWAPLILTFLFFIFFANAIGMIPIFDVLGVVNRFILHVPANDSHNFINGLLHGGPTATGNFNVTAALAMITFISIIIAGTRAHGFIQHWKNLVPRGLPGFVYIILIPIEIIGMFVKPFALTMRLAANMTGGHIALLAILSFMAIFADIFHSLLAGIGVALISVPLAAAISGLEIIVIIVQAYVFTLLSAVFIGMAINIHH